MKFEWPQKGSPILSIWVGEMSRATSLEFAREAELIQLVADADFLAREVDYLITRYALCKVIYNGAPLENGVHTIDTGSGDTITLELPLTRENFNQLPVSLAAAWTKAAEAENDYLTTFFLSALQKIATDTNGTLPANAP